MLLSVRELKKYNCEIKVVLLDRHKEIHAYIRTNIQKLRMNLIYGIWVKVWWSGFNPLKKKKYSDVFLWKSSVNNHLWWSTQTREGNGKLLVDKFTSVLYHISNNHEWVKDGIRKECQHEKLSENKIKIKLCLNPNSESYYDFKKKITSKDLLKDLEHAKNFVHTGRLELHHNLRLKYMPKRIHLKYKNIHIRSIIANLDHNHNINKKD